MTQTKTFIITSEFDVMKARLFGKKMAAAIGFGEISVAEIEIVISELGTNIVKHADAKGSLMFHTITDDKVRGMEIIARDQGRGIRDIDSAVLGGKSSAGTLGIGLSGVKRLTHELDFQSNDDNGTIIRARKWMTKDYRSEVKCSVLSKPKLGETVSGDTYFFKRLPSLVIFSVIDALGHGFDAHRVADQALRILENNCQDPLPTIIERCHKALENSRGAAMALGKIEFKTRKFHHVAVGNVETRVYGATDLCRPIFSHGTLGMSIERVRMNQYPYVKGSCIVMFSDGISNKFGIEPAMLRKTPQEISNHIFTHYAKDHDDATVLVLK